MTIRLTIWCPCGRRMAPVVGTKTQVCACGAGVDVDLEMTQAGADRCQAWVGRVRCGKYIPHDRPKFISPHHRTKTDYQFGREMVCDDCAKRLLDLAVADDIGRKYLIKAIGEREIQNARWEMARDEHEKREAARREREEVLRATRESALHLVYYVRLGENHIKIGTTTRLAERMVELRVANRENLLAVEPGGFEHEQQRHKQFNKLRYQRRKEDFAESPELLTLITELRSTWGDPWDAAARLFAGQEGAPVQSA